MGVALLKRGKILEELGNEEEAIASLREAVRMADKRSRLGLYARQNLALSLALAGRFAEAERFLLEVRGELEGSGRPLDRLRLQWTEGKVAFGLGRLREAEILFRQVQAEFLARGMGYDAALVSLDLAILFASSTAPRTSSGWPPRSCRSSSRATCTARRSPPSSSSRTPARRSG